LGSVRSQGLARSGSAASARHVAPLPPAAAAGGRELSGDGSEDDGSLFLSDFTTDLMRKKAAGSNSLASFASSSSATAAAPVSSLRQAAPAAAPMQVDAAFAAPPQSLPPAAAASGVPLPSIRFAGGAVARTAAPALPRALPLSFGALRGMLTGGSELDAASAESARSTSEAAAAYELERHKRSRLGSAGSRSGSHLAPHPQQHGAAAATAASARADVCRPHRVLTAVGAALQLQLQQDTPSAGASALQREAASLPTAASGSVSCAASSSNVAASPASSAAVRSRSAVTAADVSRFASKLSPSRRGAAEALPAALSPPTPVRLPTGTGARGHLLGQQHFPVVAQFGAHPHPHPRLQGHASGHVTAGLHASRRVGAPAPLPTLLPRLSSAGSPAETPSNDGVALVQAGASAASESRHTPSAPAAPAPPRLRASRSFHHDHNAIAPAPAPGSPSELDLHPACDSGSSGRWPAAGDGSHGRDRAMEFTGVLTDGEVPSAEVALLAQEDGEGHAASSGMDLGEGDEDDGEAEEDSEADDIVAPELRRDASIAYALRFGSARGSASPAV
jgi:hypothetical protein